MTYDDTEIEQHADGQQAYHQQHTLHRFDAVQDVFFREAVADNQPCRKRAISRRKACVFRQAGTDKAPAQRGNRDQIIVLLDGLFKQQMDFLLA